MKDNTTMITALRTEKISLDRIECREAIKKRQSLPAHVELKRSIENVLHTRCNSVDFTDDDLFLSYEDALEIVKSISRQESANTPETPSTPSERFLVKLPNIRNRRRYSNERPVKPEDQFTMKFFLRNQ
jgi:hypothetical protein